MDRKIVRISQKKINRIMYKIIITVCINNIQSQMLCYTMLLPSVKAHSQYIVSSETKT